MARLYYIQYVLFVYIHIYLYMCTYIVNHIRYKYISVHEIYMYIKHVVDKHLGIQKFVIFRSAQAVHGQIWIQPLIWIQDATTPRSSGMKP